MRLLWDIFFGLRVRNEIMRAINYPPTYMIRCPLAYKFMCLCEEHLWEQHIRLRTIKSTEIFEKYVWACVLLFVGFEFDTIASQRVVYFIARMLVTDSNLLLCATQFESPAGNHCIFLLIYLRSGVENKRWRGDENKLNFWQQQLRALHCKVCSNITDSSLIEISIKKFAHAPSYSDD